MMSEQEFKRMMEESRQEQARLQEEIDKLNKWMRKHKKHHKRNPAKENKLRKGSSIREGIQK